MIGDWKLRSKVTQTVGLAVCGFPQLTRVSLHLIVVGKGFALPQLF